MSRLSYSSFCNCGRSTGGRASAFALAETLGAVTALQQVCQEGDPLAMVRGPAGPSAPGATPQEILQILCEQSITAAGRKAVGVAIAAVPGALQRLMTLMQVCKTNKQAALCSSYLGFRVQAQSHQRYSRYGGSYRAAAGVSPSHQARQLCCELLGCPQAQAGEYYSSPHVAIDSVDV